MVWDDLPDKIHSAPTLACFRKRLKSNLFKKAFPSQHTLYPLSLWYWTWQQLWNDDFLELHFGVTPYSLLGRDKVP